MHSQQQTLYFCIDITITEKKSQMTKTNAALVQMCNNTKYLLLFLCHVARCYEPLEELRVLSCVVIAFDDYPIYLSPRLSYRKRQNYLLLFGMFRRDVITTIDKHKINWKACHIRLFMLWFLPA